MPEETEVLQKEKRSKFNVGSNLEKRTYDGILFDSAMEMKYYRDVVLPLSRSGEIKHFELQKKYTLQPKYKHNGKTILPIEYIADFYLEYEDGRVDVIDTKGFADSTARMKRKMFWYLFPELNYRWITYVKKYGGWCDWDDVNHLRRQDKKNRKEEKENEEDV